eukprot:Gregarina_sp_Poly_1__8521@NODE_502_length_7877_cov_467_844558_g402_i0_p10_GENE_NODE_502_length_7877_cov_467_844558_g402_i0NODE_502_length_7877_cov_467_844558_g402_i0_p10_ORF_typecomplete_len101_score12_00_NODE_502_length_7877_cov_467_844558_g402_i069467248
MSSVPALATQIPTSAPWVRTVDCVGLPPIARYTQAEMLDFLNKSQTRLQVVLDPWTPLLPTPTETNSKEQELRNNSKVQAERHFWCFGGRSHRSRPCPES